MAFEWDALHEKVLANRRFASRAQHFESKFPVAGSSLEIDAVVEGPSPDPFFDFLSHFTLFENKAPDETFGRADLLAVAARTLLYAKKRKLHLKQLRDVTQVILCSRATREIKRTALVKPLREGVLEGHFAARLILVEANSLSVREEPVPLLVYFANGDKLREAIAWLVDHDRHEQDSMLFLLREQEFKEVLTMKGKTVDKTTLSIRAAVEELGIEWFVETIGVDRIGEALGVEKLEALLERMKQQAARPPAPSRRKPSDS